MFARQFKIKFGMKVEYNNLYTHFVFTTLNHNIVQSVAEAKVEAPEYEIKK